MQQAQQDGALVALQKVEPFLQQTVLDEWDVRCRGTTVRSPAGYLFGIIQRAMRGEFNVWAAKLESASTATSATAIAQKPSTASSQPKVLSDVAKQHIDQIRKMLHVG